METDSPREDTARELSDQLMGLPEDVLDNLLESHRGSFRLTLVPGYRTNTLFGRPIGCVYPWVLTASGNSRTDGVGRFTIRVDDLLNCVGKGAPIPGGLVVPVDTDHSVTLLFQTIAAGVPAAVVTAVGKPAVFSATATEFHEFTPSPTEFYLGWTSESPGTLTAAKKIEIRSFQLDGSPLPGAPFNWHVTIEVWGQFTG